MEVHLLLEELTVPIWLEATLTIQETATGYSVSGPLGMFKGLGETPEDAILDYICQTLKRRSFFSEHFPKG